MLCLRKNKYHIAAALLTAVLLCPGSENFNKNSNLLAWWGTIYPQFCFMEAPRTENGQKAEPRFHLDCGDVTVRKKHFAECYQ